MPRLSIIYHAPSPNVQKLVDAIVGGARDGSPEGIDVQATPALDAGPDDLNLCAGVIFATTENFGYMSGALKDFFDRSFYPCEGKVDGIPYALLVKAGMDGTGTVQAVTRIVTGLKLRQVAEPLMLVGDFRDAWIEDSRNLGMTIAAGLEAGIF
jgi:NAD(P)H-dependent FMN reductase